MYAVTCTTEHVLYIVYYTVLYNMYMQILLIQYLCSITVHILFLIALSFKADELLTLLGTGTLGEDELEELLSITGRNREEMTHRLNREGRPSAIYNDPLVAQEIRSWVTMADRAATGNTASSSSSAPVTGGSKIKGGNTRKDSGTSMYFSSKACWRFGDVRVMVLYVHVHDYMYMLCEHVHVHVHV